MPRFKEGPGPEQKYPITGEGESEKKVQLEEYNKLFKALNDLLGKPKGVTETNNFAGYVSNDIIKNIAKALTEKNQLTRNELIEIIRTTMPGYTEDYINQLANEIIGRIGNAAPFRPFFVDGTTIVKNTEGGTDNKQTFKFIETIEHHQINEVGIAGQTETNQPNQTQNKNKVGRNKRLPNIVPKRSDQTKTNQLPETKNNEKLVYSIINYFDKNKKILDINITEQDRKQFLNIKSFYNGELSQKQIELVADQEYTITIPLDKKYINKVKETLDNLKEKFEADKKLIVLPEIKDGNLMITLAPIFNFEIINIESPPLTNTTKPNEQEKSTTKQDNKSTQEIQAKKPQEPYKPPETTTQRNEEKTTEQKSKSTQEVETEESIGKYTINSTKEWENRKQKIKNDVEDGKTVQIEFTDKNGWLIWIAEEYFSDEEFSKIKNGNILTITKK